MINICSLANDEHGCGKSIRTALYASVMQRVYQASSDIGFFCGILCASEVGGAFSFATGFPPTDFVGVLRTAAMRCHGHTGLVPVWRVSAVLPGTSATGLQQSIVVATWQTAKDAAVDDETRY